MLFQEDLTFEKCLRYKVDWLEHISTNSLSTLNRSSDWPVEPCLNGYEYNISEVQSSVVIDVSMPRLRDVLHDIFEVCCVAL